MGDYYRLHCVADVGGGIAQQEPLPSGRNRNGACATVLIVPTFANMPMVCSVVLTGWITFCLWLSLLERTPRAYAFVLAGYTASLIGFPAVSEPGAILTSPSFGCRRLRLVSSARR